MDDDRRELRARLTEIDERLDRIGKRLTAGYGSDSDRDGWLHWIRRLEAQRHEVERRLRSATEPPADG